MSGSDNSPTGTLEERLRLGAGFTAADRLRILGPVRTRAAPVWMGTRSGRHRGVIGKTPRALTRSVTLQAWLAGRASPVATSHKRDLDHALAEVRRDLIRQIEDEKSRREPRKGRKTRYRAT
jgi:hypothetical protein